MAVLPARVETLTRNSYVSRSGGVVSLDVETEPSGELIEKGLPWASVKTPTCEVDTSYPMEAVKVVLSTRTHARRR